MADAATQQSPAPSPPIASLTGDMPPSSSSAIADLTKLKKSQLAEETKVIGDADTRLAKDQNRVEAAFKAEGVGGEDLKPWDADKEHRKYEADPIQGIGSFGSLFAVAAAAFTKAPATNAMLGMAGAIEATKQGNEEAYNRAFASWKENTKLAEQRHKMMHEQYQDATSLMSTNMAAGQAKLHNLAVKYGDQNALMFLEHGMNKELFDMMSARDKAMSEQIELGDKVTQHTFQKMAIDEIKKNPPNTGDPVADRMQMAGMVQHILDPSAKYGSAEQEAVGRYVMAHMKDPPDKLADGLADLHQQFARGAEMEQLRKDFIDQRTQAIRDTGKEPTADDLAKISQEAAALGHGGRNAAGAGGEPHNGPQLKLAQIKEIQAEGKADGKWQTLNEAENEWKRRQSQPSLPPEEIKKFGEQLASGDTSVLTNIGRGAQSAANVVAIRKAAYDIIEERGGKPADLAMLNARYQGLKAAERSSATQEMKMGAAAWEASNQADLALSLSDKLPRSRIVPFNAAVQKFEEKTSDPDMNSFASANNTFVNSYVRAISPTGISTDLVRKHAYDMLNTALSEEAYRKVVGVLKQEMRLAVVSPGQMLKQMEAEYKHNADPASPAPPGMATTTNPLNDTSKVIKYDKDGNRVQ